MLFSLCSSRKKKKHQCKIEFSSCRTQYICLAVKISYFPPRVVFGLQKEESGHEQNLGFLMFLVHTSKTQRQDAHFGATESLPVCMDRLEVVPKCPQVSTDFSLNKTQDNLLLEWEKSGIITGLH